MSITRTPVLKLPAEQRDVYNRLFEIHRKKRTLNKTLRDLNAQYKQTLSIVDSAMQKNSLQAVSDHNLEVVRLKKKRHVMIGRDFLKGTISKFYASETSSDVSRAAMPERITDYVMKERKIGKITDCLSVRGVRSGSSVRSLNTAATSVSMQEKNPNSDNSPIKPVSVVQQEATETKKEVTKSEYQDMLL